MTFLERVSVSIRGVVDECRAIIGHFPESVVASFVLFAATSIGNHGEMPREGDVWRLQMTALNVLPLGIILVLLGKRLGLKPFVRTALLAALAVLDFLLLKTYASARYFAYFHGFLSASLYVWVLAALAMSSESSKDFWSKVKGMLQWGFRNGLTVGLSFGVAMLCLYSVEKLFDVNVPRKVYDDVTFFNFCVVVPFFVLGFFRREPRLHPVEGTAFETFLFLRCVPTLWSLFALVLMAYYAKLLVTWNLPKGVLTPLALTGLGMGLVSYVLSYPWMKGILPGGVATRILRANLTVLFVVNLSLGLAILVRTRAYGITEERYFIWVVFAWINFVCAWAALRRRWPLRIIFPSIAVLLLLVAKGPWSAPDVSRRSQLKVLKQILAEKNQLDSSGRWPRPTGSSGLDTESGERVRSIVSYLFRHHGESSLTELLPAGQRVTELGSIWKTQEAFFNEYKVPEHRAADDWRSHHREVLRVTEPAWVIEARLWKGEEKSVRLGNGARVSWRYIESAEAMELDWEKVGKFRLELRPILCGEKGWPDPFAEVVWHLSERPKVRFVPRDIRFNCEGKDAESVKAHIMGSWLLGLKP